MYYLLSGKRCSPETTKTTGLYMKIVSESSLTCLVKDKLQDFVSTKKLNEKTSITHTQDNLL